MSSPSSLKAVYRRDRLLILGGLAVLTLLAWGTMAGMAGRMNAAPVPAWGVSEFLVAFGMWSVMMMGMMLPSASPMVLTFAGISRRRAPDHSILTPLKEACLTGCRSPMGFLMAAWRPGRRGAFVMGLRHGWNCAGCCWATMALMFVLGVMNLLWMAALTALCLIEKIAPAGDRIGRIAGVGFIGWGGWLLAGALL
jgi:predicted metal-binding membrane protein